MVSGERHDPANPLRPSISATMPPSYHFALRAMRQNSNRAGGSPGEMFPDFPIPADGQRHDVDFVYRDEIATFEHVRKQDENIESTDTKARFCELYLHILLLYSLERHD
jgi:hypothetical protein